jgi:hypothetical protein
MARSTRIAASALLAAAALVIADSSAAASAETAGSERFNGFLIASGASGTRQIVATQVVARGIFNGFGRIVEIQNRPTGCSPFTPAT